MHEYWIPIGSKLKISLGHQPVGVIVEQQMVADTLIRRPGKNERVS